MIDLLENIAGLKNILTENNNYQFVSDNSEQELDENIIEEIELSEDNNSTCEYKSSENDT